jgi:hypothetical protein
VKTKIITYIFTAPCTATIQIFQVFPDSPSKNNKERQPKTGQMFAKNDTVTPKNI